MTTYTKEEAEELEVDELIDAFLEADRLNQANPSSYDDEDEQVKILRRTLVERIDEFSPKT